MYVNYLGRDCETEELVMFSESGSWVCHGFFDKLLYKSNNEANIDIYIGWAFCDELCILLCIKL